MSDVRLYCDGLAAVLPRDRLSAVGVAEGRAAASTVVRELSPDVVLVDVATPEAFDLIRQLRADPPPVQIVAFGVPDDDMATIIECAEAGAMAYVPSGARVDELARIVESAVVGELQCPPRVAGELFRRAADWSRGKAEPAAASPEPILTTRQRQVLSMLRQSLSNKEIAAALNISEATVKNHVHNILGKLQVPTRAKAATCLPRPGRARTDAVQARPAVGQRLVPLASAS